MSSPLDGIPVARRRLLAATLGLFATLFVAVGVVSFAGGATGLVTVFATVAILVALLLALMSWGVTHSIAIDQAADRLDAVIAEALARHDMSCDCGHDHDAAELHPSEESTGNPAGTGCKHDGAGAGCEHDCQTCLLAALRPSPDTPRAERLPR